MKDEIKLLKKEKEFLVDLLKRVSDDAEHLLDLCSTLCSICDDITECWCKDSCENKETCCGLCKWKYKDEVESALQNGRRIENEIY